MLAQAQTRRREFYGLAGRVLAVETDDEPAAHLLGSAYGPAQQPGSAGHDHTAHIKRLRDGRICAQFDRGPVPLDDRHSSTPLLTAHYATREIFARFAAARPDGIALYAAAVAIDGAALLLLGPTTIGKTVLALHLALQGSEFLGDETAVLDFRSTTIAALARKPSLRESALPFLPESLCRSIDKAANVMETARGRFWYALESSDLGGIEPSRRDFPLRAICIVRERAPSVELHRATYAQALPAILQRAYARPSRLAQLSALGRSLRSTAFFEMRLADPAASAAALLREVRACA